MMEKSTATISARTEPPEEFAALADRLLQSHRHQAVPIPAKSGEGLFEACQSVARSMRVELQPVATDPADPRSEALDKILHTAGLRCRLCVLDTHFYTGDSGPFLAFLKDSGRPVALVPQKAGKYVLLDPVARKSLPVDAATFSLIQTEAFTFYRPFPKGPLNAGTVLAHAFQGSSGDVSVVLILGLLASLLGLLSPLAMEFVINNLIPGGERSQLLQIGMGLVLVGVAITLFRATAAIATLRIEGRGEHSVLTAIWSRVLELHTGFFKNYSAGDLANRVDGISAIRRALSSAVVGSLLGMVFSLTNLALIFYYSWKLAIAAIILVLLCGLVDIATALLLLRLRRRSQELSGSILGRVYQLLNGIVKWKTAAAEDRALAQWSSIFLEKKRIDKLSGMIEAGASSFRAFFPVFATLVNFAFYFFFLHGDLNAGAFIAYNAAFGQLLVGVLGATSATITLVKCIPHYERLRPILNAPVERDLAGADPGRLAGRVDVRNLRFRYAPDQPLVLDGVDFSIEPGQFVAVVGATGCGKSTLVRLLLGFESPVSGDILYDGRDLRNLDLRLVRRQLGVVLQNDRVLGGDIFHNISGAGYFSMNEVWQAAERAGIKDEIARLPMGMHTVIPDGGSGFSGGQLQRLLIARALIKNPTLLLFDEATSALDNASQKIVSDNLRALKVTRIVIAQRLSSIKSADKIIVLDKGKVAESGTYDELIAKNGIFQRLAARQMV